MSLVFRFGVILTCHARNKKPIPAFLNMSTPTIYYKFLPILCTGLAFAMISTIVNSYAANDNHDIDESATFGALKSDGFHHSIYVSLGILIPIAVDHLLTLSTLWSPDMFIHIESYIMPLLIIVLQVCNIYLISAESNLSYFWAYHNIINFELCILCNAIFVIQLYSLQKYSSTLTTCMCAMYLFNLCLVLKLLISLYHVRWLIAIWAVFFFLLFVACFMIASDWYSSYQTVIKTGLQDQSSMYSLIEMLLLTALITLTQIYDVMVNDQIIYHCSSNRVVAYNIIIITCFYFFSEIYVLKNKQMAKFSMDSLELKRSFVRYVSHEIRTPLNAATVGLQLLEKEIRKQISKLPPTANVGCNQIMELVGDTGQAITIAIDTLNDLLLYEKIDGGLLVLDAQEVILWPYIEEVLKIFKVQAKASELELLWQPLLDSKVFVNIDRYKMSQVIRNVVSNAVKFSEPGQRIIVGAEFITASKKSSPKAHQQYAVAAGISADVESQSSSTDQRSELDNTIQQQPTISTRSSSVLGTVTSNLRDSISSMWKVWNEFDDDSVPNNRSENTPSSLTSSSSHNNSTKTDMIRIFVTDFGPGISKENQKRLFSEIVQFDAVKLQQGKGSGIGLWVSNKIMKLHGGRIGVASDGEGQGSTFYIDIPVLRAHSVAPTTTTTIHATANTARSKVALRDMLRHMITSGEERVAVDDEPLKPPPLNQSSPSPTGTIPVPPTDNPPVPDPGTPSVVTAIHRVLVVDDSTVNRKMLKKICFSLFDSVTVTVDEAVNGHDALRKIAAYYAPYTAHTASTTASIAGTTHPPPPLEAFGYDVIILDYFMPEMNGLEVMEELQRMKYPGKVVGLTGNTDDAMKEAFLSAGADMVLIKPLQGEDLQRLVDRLSSPPLS